MFTVNRSKYNPILSPVREHPWEAAAVFNGCPVMVGQKKYLVYRAQSDIDPLKRIPISVIGRALLKGVSYADRNVLVSPDKDFDQFGCEDPRVTKFKDTYYIFYTALGGYPFSSGNIRVAVALSKDLKTIKEKHLVTPFNAKAMALFPEPINGKMAALLTVGTDEPPSHICYAEFDAKEDIWSAEFWNNWKANLEAHKLHIRRQNDDQLELGAAPLKTDKGWLIVYSHIQKYGSSNPVFGVEAVLLDLLNPRKILGRTKGPFMVADAYYEKVGHVGNIVFPSGAIIEGNKLRLYYGAADTYCALASIPLDNLLASLIEPEEKHIKRFPGNPIIAPRPGLDWEAKGTLNPAAIEIDKKIHLLYRAVSNNNISTLGYACSRDGLSIDERSDTPIYSPRESFERMGCEDPRLVAIGKRIYMTYTGYDGTTPRVSVSSIDIKDFLAKRWELWSKPEAITPEHVDDKDAVILPEPIKGKYLILHRIQENVCADYISSLDFSKERVTECIEIINPRRGMWDGGKVGIAAPPLKTKNGWLVFYHGVSWSTTYRIGAVLLDLDDPTIVRARTAIPLFEPEEEYERKGVVPNVIFPCGIVLRGATIYMYYGAADLVIGVATVKLATLLRMLKN
jgi:predicted GH43/DUF377 family glycosyl hydrolase